MKTDYIKWLIEHGAQYQIRYIDYTEDHYTVPVKLTEDRVKNLFDHSIVEVKFTM